MAPVQSRVTRSMVKGIITHCMLSKRSIMSLLDTYRYLLISTEMASYPIDPNTDLLSELPPVDGDPPAWAEVREYDKACSSDSHLSDQFDSFALPYVTRLNGFALFKVVFTTMTRLPLVSF